MGGKQFRNLREDRVKMRTLAVTVASRGAVAGRRLRGRAHAAQHKQAARGSPESVS
jgi:hypothetical protein